MPAPLISTSSKDRTAAGSSGDGKTPFQKEETLTRNRPREGSNLPLPVGWGVRGQDSDTNKHKNTRLQLSTEHRIYLLNGTLSLEEDASPQQLSKDAANRPDIDGI